MQIIYMFEFYSDTLQLLDKELIESHPSNDDVVVLNIVSGVLASSNVNLDYLVTIDTRQMPEYEYWLPHSFHSVLDKRIITMTVSKKSIQIDVQPIYDMDLINTRVMCLQQSRDININEVLTCELSPVSISYSSSNTINNKRSPDPNKDYFCWTT